MDYQEDFTKFLNTLNPWWKNKDFRFEVVQRQFSAKKLLKRNDHMIDILIGSRRVGKTYLLYTIINELLNKQVNPKNILFLTAELPETQKNGLLNTIEHFKSLNYTHEQKQLYVFVDEVQELENWQKQLKLLYDSTNIKFFISGSSSLLITQGTAKLAGRFVLHRILPLNFKEFLDFSNIDYTKEKKQLLNDSLKSYLLYGGYPEFVLKRPQNPAYLKQLVDTTLYRDLIENYGIRNPSVLESILEALADKMTNQVSNRSIATQVDIDDETAKLYLQYLQDIFLIYPVFRKAASHKRSKGYSPKYYFNDTGILNLVGIRSRIGHLLENAIFLKLLNDSHGEKYHIFYDMISGAEIDFDTKKQSYEIKSKQLSIGEIVSIRENILETHNGPKNLTIIMPDITDEHINFDKRIKFIDPVNFLLN